MKKWVFALAFALLLTGFCGLAEEARDPFAGRWQDPVYGRAVLSIVRVETGYDIRIVWGGSADSQGVWRMSAVREGERLVYADGSLTYQTYGEGGALIGEDAQYADAEGAFTLNGDGRLSWADSRESRAPEFAFERLPSLTPSAPEWKARFLEPIADQTPGAAGASLKQAQTVADLLRFVDEYQLWDGDLPALRESLREAWTLLDEAARDRFDAHRPGVVSLAETALADYPSTAGLFEDVGAEDMADLTRDEAIRQGWRTLLDALSALDD